MDEVFDEQPASRSALRGGQIPGAGPSRTRPAARASCRELPRIFERGRPLRLRHPDLERATAACSLRSCRARRARCAVPGAAAACAPARSRRRGLARLHHRAGTTASVQVAQRRSCERSVLRGRGERRALFAAAAVVLLVLIGAAARGWRCGRGLAAAATRRRATWRRAAQPRSQPIDAARVPRRDRSRWSRAFNGLMGRLARRLRAQRRFVADAAHELRTPVAALRPAAAVRCERACRRGARARALSGELERRHRRAHST